MKNHIALRIVLIINTIYVLIAISAVATSIGFFFFGAVGYGMFLIYVVLLLGPHLVYDIIVFAAAVVDFKKTGNKKLLVYTILLDIMNIALNISCIVIASELRIN